jgi:hypothetical protein
MSMTTELQCDIALCRLQTLLDMEKRQHVTYLTISVEGHELPVRRSAHQPTCVHAKLMTILHTKVLLATMPLTMTAVSCPPLNVMSAIAGLAEHTVEPGHRRCARGGCPFRGGPW